MYFLNVQTGQQCDENDTRYIQAQIFINLGTYEDTLNSLCMTKLIENSLPIA